MNNRPCINILEEIYYGNLDPNTKYFDRNSKYGKFIKAVADNEEKLNNCLNEEEKQYLTQLTKALDEIHDIEAKERFIDGVRLGARFMLDTFLVT